MMFIACTKHSDKNFLGISSCDTLSCPMRQAILPFFKALLGEGNGTPLQYSCLESPMDGGAWWAAVHGVTRVRHD